MTSAAEAQAEAAAAAAAEAESRALQAREQLASARQLLKVSTSPACLPCDYCHSPQNLESDALTRRRRAQEAQQKIAVRLFLASSPILSISILSWLFFFHANGIIPASSGSAIIHRVS